MDIKRALQKAGVNVVHDVCYLPRFLGNLRIREKRRQHSNENAPASNASAVGE